MAGLRWCPCSRLQAATWTPPQPSYRNDAQSNIHKIATYVDIARLTADKFELRHHDVLRYELRY